MFKRTIYLIIIALLAAILSGCGGSSSKQADTSLIKTGTGRLMVTIPWPSADSRTIPSNTTKIEVIVAGAGQDTQTKIANRQNGETQATLVFENLSPGSKKITVYAYDSVPTVVAQGEGTVDLANDQTAQLTIELRLLTDVDVYIATGQSYLNKVASMEPFDATTAANYIQQAKNNFQTAKNLANDNSKANFGLAIANAALVGQELILKYQSTFASRGASTTSLGPGASLLFWKTGQNLSGPDNPITSSVNSYLNMVNIAYGNSLPSDAELLASMQTDLRQTLVPLLVQTAQYLEITEQDSGFAFQIGIPGDENYAIVDQGDVYLFHSGLLFAKAFMAIPAAYNLDLGSFNTSIDLIDRDANHDGTITPEEYLPASPFGTLTDESYIKAMKTDFTAACQLSIKGVDATLAETSDNYDLIAWHTPGSDVTQADLTKYREAADNLLKCCSGPYVFTYTVTEDNWQWDNGTWKIITESETFTLNSYLGAWSDNPPASLRALSPTYEINGQFYRVKAGGYADPTFGGMFPDGLSDTMLYPQ